MRSLLAILVLASTLPAFAARYGKDERAYVCTSVAEDGPLMDKQKFRVHILDKKELTITRLSDGQYLKSLQYNGFFLFGGKASEGTLLPNSQGGYITIYDGEYSLALVKTPGTYINGGRLRECQLEKVISEYDPMSATEMKLEDIGNNANLGNGGYDFTRFDRQHLNMSQEWDELEQQGQEWEQCTWEKMEGLENILNLIEEHTYDPETAHTLKAMTLDPGFSRAMAYVSDDDISCSNTIVRLYSNDGIRLELFYSQGD